MFHYLRSYRAYRPGSWRSCRQGDCDGQSITDHAGRPQYLSCTSYTPTHTDTVSRTHDMHRAWAHPTSHHNKSSTGWQRTILTYSFFFFYLWCQTTRGRGSAAWRPHPRSQPPCHSPWLWNCRKAHQTAVAELREAVDGSTRCGGELWRTSEDDRCLLLWSEESSTGILKQWICMLIKESVTHN